ncbi:MAG: hypothetical protein IPK80_32265 [Nannocystis sp.]|nr:hypothetical protein [Nannocystis sp.]
MSEAPCIGLSEFALHRLLRPEEAGRRLSLLDGGALWLTVEGEMRVNLEGTLVISEGLEIHHDGPLALVRGVGQILIAPRGQAFHLVRFHRDDCCLRASAVWALDGAIEVAAATLPGWSEEALRLRGDGAAALRLAGEVIAVKVRPGAPQRVAAAGLLGWIGDLVAALDGDGVLRCEGEGALLLAQGPGSQRQRGRGDEAF